MATTVGMDRRSGEQLPNSVEHLRQSVTDILTTPVGTRVMRRDYGSRLPELIDRPIDSALKLALFSETAGALRRWEPRLKVERVWVPEVGVGWIEVALRVIFRPTGEAITLEGILIR